ncbi:MAG: ankyrin repeat domain-containing protein [Gemmatimonadetes bacterium]|nr:ankyrin repeat domain-containing protein [Gemmatimonadota bacterium]
MTRSGRSLAAAVLAIALLTAAVVPDARSLLEATKRGDLATVRSLLRDGADPNAAQGDGLTALHLAAQDGKLEIAKVLLGAGAKVTATTRIGAYTPLHLASAGAHEGVVRALLDAGADPKMATTASGVTPLHLAAKALNGESTARVLIERGAPVNALEASAGQTPLMFAASYGRAATVKELLSHGADPSIGTRVVDVLERMVIDRAAQARLRKAMDDIRKSSPAGGENRDLTPTERQAAIEAQRAFLRSDDVQKLLAGFNPDQLARKQKYPGTDIEYLSRPIWETLVGKEGGMTALLHAAREGHIAAAQALLDGGASIDQMSGGDGSSPLLTAAQNGQFDLALMLIERGANPNIAARTDGVAPLFAVVQVQWSNFTSHPAPRAQDNQQSGYMDVLAALLKAGADPNMRIKTHLWYWEFGDRAGLDIAGATAFWRAAYALDLDAMKLLAAHGADSNLPTKWGEVGLRASRQEDGRAGDDSGLPPIAPGSPNMYPIHAAAGGGWIGFIAIDQNQVPNNFLNVVEYLVEEHHADVNVANSWGYTPLHYAAARGDIPMIDYLVSKGANVKAASRLGQSTVDFARGGGAGFHKRTVQPEAVKRLLSLGAEFRCLDTQFKGTGAWCARSGVPLYDGVVPPVEEPTPPVEPVATSPAAARLMR